MDDRELGDFPAAIEELMDAAGRGEGPTTMADIKRVAARVAGALDEDPDVLAWLRENAMPLIGQQLLVASVQAVADPGSAIDVALADARDVLSASAGPAELIDWLMENRPGVLRAWVVRVELPRLIEERL